MVETCSCSTCVQLAEEFPADGPQLAFISSGEPAGMGSPSPIDAPAHPYAGVSNPKAAQSKTARGRTPGAAHVAGQRPGKPETVHG